MKRLVFGFFVLIFLSFNADAVSLRDVLKEALDNNPSIKAARSRHESAKSRIPQASSLDDPWITYDYEENPGREMGSYIISQKIPFPTKLISRSNVANSEAKSRYEEYKEKKREIFTKVKSTYAELYLAYRMIQINKENRALLEQFSNSATSRFSLGKTGQQDALRAQVEIAKIDNNLIIWEQKRIAGNARLCILLNRLPEDAMGEPIIENNIDNLPSIDELYSLSKANRPELKAWRYLIDKARNSLSLSRQEYLPDFMLSYKDIQDTDDWEAMIGISIPLWFWQKQNFMVKEMSAELQMAEADYKHMENEVLFEVKDMYTQVLAYKKLKELYETSFLPQSDQSLKASLTGYESGEVDFLSLLDSQRMLLEFQMEYYDILVNLEVAIAELEGAIGLDLKGGLTE